MFKRALTTDSAAIIKAYELLQGFVDSLEDGNHVADLEDLINNCILVRTLDYSIISTSRAFMIHM